MTAGEVAPLFRIFSVFSFVLGTCIGSFMNVVVWRLPRGESLNHPPSHCPKCGHAIPPWENIPIISWLCLKARCSKCHLPISVRYPIGESLTGLLFTLVWWRVFHLNLDMAVIPGYFFVTGALLAVALIDAEHRFIPDEVTYSGLVLALALAYFLPDGRAVVTAGTRPDHGILIFTGFQELLSRLGIVLGGRKMMSLADCLLGAAMGFAILAAVAWSFKRLFGTGLSRRFAKGIRMSLSAKGLRHGEEESSWEDLLDEPADIVTLHGRIPGRNGLAKVLANAAGYSVDGVQQAWGKEALELEVSRLSMPQDSVGGGDVKLLAMLGAFFGADAVIYILFGGALLGLVYAGLRWLSRGRLQAALPFGPFLAVAAFLWMMWR